MIPIGVGVVFAAYTTGIWGYCLVRGYNVTFTQLFAATWPAAKTNAAQQFGQTVAGLPGELNPQPTPTTRGSFPTQVTGGG